MVTQVVHCFTAILALALASDYDDAVALIERGRHDKAVPLLIRAAGARPGDAQTWKTLGVAYAAQNQYLLAEPAFRRACAINSGLEDACYYHGRTLYALDPVRRICTGVAWSTNRSANRIGFGCRPASSPAMPGRKRGSQSAPCR